MQVREHTFYVVFMVDCHISVAFCCLMNMYWVVLLMILN